MENLADALKISFSVLVFIVAIAITFSMMSKAKLASDVVLYHADKTNFYSYEDSKEENRIVDISTIVATLYKSMEESITVSVVNDRGEEFGVEYNGNIISQFSANSEEVINKFITDNINSIKGHEYIEDFIEVPLTGIYKTADDGTQITVENGVKKIYITYYDRTYYNNIKSSK